MHTQIFLTVLIVSFLVLVVMLLKKAPELANIEVPLEKRDNIVLFFYKKVIEIPFIKEFSWNKFLQKILSKTRILILKTERIIGDQLHSLRKRSEKKKK